tara:strand:+ start:20896 stop:21060 length:165 start_codon:yes stop_codon:yes gene_type:complete
MTNHQAPRMQLDLRALVDEYIAEGWELARGEPLGLVKGDQRKLAELQDMSGRWA